MRKLFLVYATISGVLISSRLAVLGGNMVGRCKLGALCSVKCSTPVIQIVDSTV